MGVVRNKPRRFTQKYLNECFIYNPATGELTWRERPRRHFRNKRGWKVFNGYYAGSVAGSVNSKTSYICVGLDGKIYAGHRLIWRMVTGDWPRRDLDHKNRKPWDNTWTNLRSATNGQNQINTYARGKIAYRGVTYKSNIKKYTARISFENKRVYIGAFDTAAEANSAYLAKARELYGEFAQ